MNLHGIAKGVVGAVNPLVPCALQVSLPSATGPSGKRTPQYATPGALTGSIDAAGVLTVQSVQQGVLMPGQALSDITAALNPGTIITNQLTGPRGGSGTYQTNFQAVVALEAMTTSLILLGQRQPVTFRDIQQLDGINLQGVRDKVYLDGTFNGLVRATGKGGDLVTFLDGSQWLVALVLEQFPDWCSLGVTLQEGGLSNPQQLFPGLLDFSRPFTPGAN